MTTGLFHQIAGRARLAGALTLAAAMALPMPSRAQTGPPEMEKLVQYAQCIRANGYSEFPDPAPDGRLQLRLDPKSAGRFETAQRACRDKAPPGMAARDQAMTPQRMQQLLAFAACVRAQGVTGFPDPSPEGVFEIKGAGPDLSTPQARQTVEKCVESHPPGALQIRRIQAR